jgi:hypothetical protein
VETQVFAQLTVCLLPPNLCFYRTFLHKEASWVIMKKVLSEL